MIGLIFGETEFPKEILKKIKKIKIKYLIIDLTNKNEFKKDKNSYHVKVGQFGKIIQILKKNNCKKIIFAGKVKKPNFKISKFDLKGVFYLPRIIKSSKLGDAALLSEIIKIFRSQKIQTLNSLTFNPELTLKKNNYTKLRPNSNDFRDIKKAIIILNNLGKYNYSQGAVVRNNKLIKIEGKNGTQAMLRACKNKKNKMDGVLAKFPKKKQDLRIDLPTIGLETIMQCKKARLKGIVLKGNQNIVLNKKKCISFANQNKMFIKVL
ncbi:MAG: hypothetical protein CL687_04375 [Candidatus Pelagibacter sp.]|nr:hypothetical protein [Candidatus Pelagibacter sp.]OUW23479.1 MAG: hypothetical protein CBD34_02770 [Rickettsiales bacterium TMED174]|tara:strand:- start:206 stop:1000 length:795 start_codon:yes stop_codon:yes gene_type:complete